MSNQADYREFLIGKFTFRVKEGLWYNRAGSWVALDLAAGAARVGLSDFRQQVSGDIAFVDVLAAGATVNQGSEIASLETVKADLEVLSPVSGAIVQVNEQLGDAPELINQDPYGEGWLVEIRLTNWAADRTDLLDAAAYFDVMKAQAEAETA